jgi:hypothetical protein
VLTYIRNSFGNNAIAITPGDVNYVRVRTKIIITQKITRSGGGGKKKIKGLY